MRHYSPADLPQVLPVFPLPGAMLLPRARLPLHIFEPRYLAMFDDVLKSDHRLLGMVQPLHGETDGTPDLHEIGCAGRLVSFSETEDQRYMITLEGVSRYCIGQEVEGFSPYRKIIPNWDGFAADLGKREKDAGFQREAFFGVLRRYFDAQELQTDWDSLQKADDEILINSLAMMCPFEPEEKQALLEAPTLAKRRETLVTLIEFSLHGGSEEHLQ